jgi:drug/metabolite transporter (DMT)-like permease
MSLPLAAVLVAAALFGAATPACKLLLRAFSPLQLAGLLYLGAAAGVLPILLWQGSLDSPRRMSGTTRARLGGALLFGGLLGPLLLLLGLRQAPSASVALWLNLELVATIALGHLLFHDRLTKTSAVAALGTLGAAVLLSASGGPASIQAGLLVLLACLCWGLDNHLTALIDGISPVQTTFWKGLVAGTINLALGLFTSPVGGGPAMVGLALLVGAVSYGASILLYIASAQRLGATRAQIVFATAPFFGVLLSLLILGETLTALQGGVVLLAAASVGVLAIERHGHAHEHGAMDHAHGHAHDDEHHRHPHPSGVIGRTHAHWHSHEPVTHAHAHWPDLHHRHAHRGDPEKPTSADRP